MANAENKPKRKTEAERAAWLAEKNAEIAARKEVGALVVATHSKKSLLWVKKLA